MSSFQQLGLSPQFSKSTETVEIMGQKTTKTFGLYMLTLPSRPKVQASFSREGLANKIVKLFKKEVQVGDKTFDDVVFVSTDTPEATKAFLSSDDIQTTILLAVTEGGSIEIVDQTVTAKIPGDETGADPSLARFVQTLIAS